MLIVITIIAYFVLLTLYSRWATGRNSTNEAFFRGNRRSPWYMVAFGMIGASISGITFVSVPGMVVNSDMTYLQTCLGFIFGYLAVAFILLPVYYRLNLTTIYSFLNQRLGNEAYKTGASFFLLSKMTGAAARFYVVCILLHNFVLHPLGIPFPVTVLVMVLLIWFYTRVGGIKTLVWTDTLQTCCMFLAVGLILYSVTNSLQMSIPDAFSAVFNDSHSRIFVFDDFASRQNFFKQFLSGIFIVIVMTGLDQDMMQKNLTCRNLRDAQKDMCTYGLAFVPVNLLFLCLGVMLTMLVAQPGNILSGTTISPDDLLPTFALNSGTLTTCLFVVGIMAAAFSSADSALTAMTTTVCVDVFQRNNDERFRRLVHIIIAIIFVFFILLFRWFNSTSLIDAVYIMCSYTYGPLLGLFLYAYFHKREPSKPTRWSFAVPVLAIASPLLCFALSTICAQMFNYTFGYELLMLNGLITYIGLCIIYRGKLI